MEKPHREISNGGFQVFHRTSLAWEMLVGPKSLPMLCSGPYSRVIAYVLDSNWRGLGDELILIAECSMLR